MSGINLSLMTATFTRSFLLTFPEHILADAVKHTRTGKACVPGVHTGVHVACAVPAPVPAFVTLSERARCFPGGSEHDGM